MYNATVATICYCTILTCHFMVQGIDVCFVNVIFAVKSKKDAALADVESGTLNFVSSGSIRLASVV